jgi:formylglycine-generating enzyme required for sulfatase activity
MSSTSLRISLAGALLPLMVLGLLPACLGEPDLEVVERPSAVIPPSSGDGGTRHERGDVMVLVAETSIDVPSVGVTPAAKGKGKGKGKADGGGGDDNGGGAGGGGGGDDNGGGGGGDDDSDDEAPADPAPGATTTVVVPEFWLDMFEVTVENYAACMAAGACSPPGADQGCTMAAGLATHPVSCVAFEQAAGYCRWRGKRLVRFEEHVAAARGEERRAFPWGSESPSAAHLNACGAECASPAMFDGSDGYVETAPTGSFPGGNTPEGIVDLAGNVAEWVEASPASLVAGGSFTDTAPEAVASGAAEPLLPTAQRPNVGFRCARDR